MNAVVQPAVPFARILDVGEHEYHADPCADPSLNQTIAKVLLSKSLLHGWTEHPRLGNLVNEDADDDAKDEKDATRAGKVIHKLLLGKGAHIEVINVDAYRTNAAREARDAAIAAGRVPIKAKQYDALAAAAETIKGNLALEGIDLDDPEGLSEVAIEFHEQGEHGPVVCRCRMDKAFLSRGVIWDLKKITSADGKTCSKHVADYGYDVQWASNTRALAALRPELADRIDMLFIFMEVQPPYAVNIKRPSAVMRETGRIQWERAVLLWERAVRTNRWAGYGGGITELDPPHWHVTDVLGNWEGTDLTDLALEK